MLTRILALSVLPAIAFAHCDGLDGPVVEAARRAISSDDPKFVLPWVAPTHEDTVRESFKRAKAARAAGSDARALADTWFFETVVRLHRASEGAPYTGLKPAGSHVPASVRAADEAITHGDIEELERRLLDSIRQALQHRFRRLAAAKEGRSASIEAGRQYVAAYVDFVHFVERLGDSAGLESKHAPDHAH